MKGNTRSTFSGIKQTCHGDVKYSMGDTVSNTVTAGTVSDGCGLIMVTTSLGI